MDKETGPDGGRDPDNVQATPINKTVSIIIV
jgi:hypothetical protein